MTTLARLQIHLSRVEEALNEPDSHENAAEFQRLNDRRRLLDAAVREMKADDPPDDDDDDDDDDEPDKFSPKRTEDGRFAAESYASEMMPAALFGIRGAK